jgi:hypothetical protein
MSIASIWAGQCNFNRNKNSASVLGTTLSIWQLNKQSTIVQVSAAVPA